MTILTSIILIGAIIAVALFIAYNVQKGTKTLKEFKTDFDNNEQAQELVQLSKELYNKDLRPVTAKKAPKKEKVAEITPEIEEIAQVTPDTTAVNVAVALEQLKEQVSTTDIAAVKPKKKRKYYPKAPKGKA